MAGTKVYNFKYGILKNCPGFRGYQSTWTQPTRYRFFSFNPVNITRSNPVSLVPTWLTIAFVPLGYGKKVIHKSLPVVRRT